MQLLDYLREYYKQYKTLPTEREMIEIRSRMEGAKGTPDIYNRSNLPMGTMGQYDPADPNAVSMNKWNGGMDTLVHELEHQGQYQYAGLDNKYRQLSLMSGAMPSNLPPKQSPNFSKLREPVYQERFSEAFSAGNAGDNTLEMLANIAAYVSRLPMGVELKDTPLGKDLIKKGLYNDVMNAMQQRVIKQVEDEKPKPKVNPKASLARQAIQYLGFKDPFEDTTKD